VQPNGEQVITPVLAVLIVWVLASATLGSHGLAHRARLSAERDELTAATAAQIAQNRELEDSIAKLREDDRALEHVARHEMNLVAPDEMVYRFHRAPRAATP
jgi:cell division protein FtsB